VDVPYFLSKYDPDPLRYYLTAVAPETRDTEFTWEDFVERNNNELVATWGTQSVANRMLSFAYKRFEGKVPEPGEFDEEDRTLLERVEAGFDTVGELYNACKFRAALGEAMGPPKALRLRRVWSARRTSTWTAKRRGSRSRRIPLLPQRRCMSSCAWWTT
jgi:methionyl-tRNA synthetase